MENSVSAMPGSMLLTRTPVPKSSNRSVRAAGVIHQHIDALGVRAHPLREGFDAGSLAHVECVNVRRGRANFARVSSDNFKSIHPARAEKKFRTFGAECDRSRCAEAAG